MHVVNTYIDIINKRSSAVQV